MNPFVSRLGSFESVLCAHQTRRRLLHVFVGAILADCILLCNQLQHLANEHDRSVFRDLQHSSLQRMVREATNRFFAGFLLLSSYQQLVENVVRLVEVEDQVQLANVPKVAVQNLHKLVDDLERDQFIVGLVNCA